MKLWTLSTLCTASLLILSGCVATPTPPEEVKVDSTLPVVSLTQNGIIVDMKTVAFEWSAVKDPRVKGIYVYKKTFGLEPQDTLKHYETINNRFKTHYLDQNVVPDTKYEYAFKTFSKDAEGVSSDLVTLNTLPVLDSISWIHSITGMPRSAKIIWRPHVNNRIKSYIVERKTLEDENWEEIATVHGRLNAEYIDSDLNDNYVYMYRVRVVTYDGIVSTPSQLVKVVTKALPNRIENIRTTVDLPRRIQIDWNKSTQKDFALYYLYKAESIDGSYELIATLHNNTFVDKVEEDGKSYFYRVSAVDKDGLESEHEESSIQGMTLPKPLAPAIVEAKLIGLKIEMQWSKTDPRTKTYIVSRKQKKGWFDITEEDYEGIRANNFTDNKIEPNSTYTYVVYGVDKNGIKSEASIEVSIQTPESTEIQNARQQEPVKEVNVAPVEDKKQEVIAPLEDLDLNEI